MNYLQGLTALLLLGTTVPTLADALDDLQLPDGFKMEVYAEGVTNARQMVRSDSGVIYVGTRGNGAVHAVVDSDGDMRADEVITVIDGLNMPNGVALKDGDLYVAEVNQVWRFDDIDETFRSKPKPVKVISGLPTERHHGWKYIGFGPDGKLYVPVGAPCNICLREDDERYASILRFDLDKPTEHEVVAHGVRNTVGFDWHPETGELWFTDNGRDMMGDDIPPCEFNRVANDGAHYGYPFLHGTEVVDPEFGDKAESMDALVTPAWNFGAHTAPLGVLFYQGKMFPEAYQGKALVAQHGSWNRSSKVGYQVVALATDGKAVSAQDSLVTGWLQKDGEEEEVSGRPVAFVEMPDGSVLISDDFANRIYRLTYSDQTSGL